MRRFDNENNVKFPPELRIGDIRTFEKSIQQLIEFRGFEKVILDFSATRIDFAEAILPIVCCVIKYSVEKVQFSVILPIYDSLARLFVNCGWANLMAPKQFRLQGLEVFDNIPAIRFSHQEEQDKLVDRSIRNVLKKVPGLERGSLRALEWSINEICDNVLNHSDSMIGGLFQLNFRPKQKEVEFIVADAGIGIPNSLRRLHHHGDWTDEVCS